MASSVTMPVVYMGAVNLNAESGASIHFREIAEGLRQAGIDPWLVCLSDDSTGRQGEHARHFRVPVSRRRFWLQISWTVFGAWKAVQAVRRSGARVIYTRLDPGMFAGLVASLVTGTALAVELNGLPTRDLELYRPHAGWLLSVSNLWERLHYRRAAVLVGAPGYIDYVCKHYSVPQEKCVKVPLGVNTDVYRPMPRCEALAELGLEERPTVVWVGTIAGWQGLEVLLLALKRLKESIPECRGLVVGDGPGRAEMEARAKTLSLCETVRFTGRVPEAKVRTLIGASHIGVCTFPGNRGEKGSISGLKTLNYLACGRPVVTTEMDEMAKEIGRAGAGLVVGPDDAEALAGALGSLLLAEPREQILRQERALSVVGEARTWRATAAAVGEALRSVG